jgi:anti-sigma-K factor RskA
MNRERFEELKESYALGNLSEAERREFERYLAENPSEQAEVDELSSIARLLALAPPEQEPPARLRKHLMNQVRAEAAESGSQGAATRTRGEGRESWARRLFGIRGAVTAAAAAILGLAVWNVSLQSEVRDLRDTQMNAYELQGSGEAQTVEGKVVKIGEQGAMLVATDLPELPEGKTYEMWSIDEGQPESCGTFEAGEGPAIETMGQSITEAEQFAITVEPEGGSGQPTTEPIVVADLTRSA